VLPRTGPSTPSTTLADNRRLVLGVLHTRGDLTRTEMAEASGLSPAATARITNALESEGLIARTEKLPSAGGRPAWRYRFTGKPCQRWTIPFGGVMGSWIRVEASPAPRC